MAKSKRAKWDCVGRATTSVGEARAVAVSSVTRLGWGVGQQRE